MDMKKPLAAWAWGAAAQAYLRGYV